MVSVVDSQAEAYGVQGAEGAEEGVEDWEEGTRCKRCEDGGVVEA